ncbi:ankyrin repeat-containing domain protein, partial [Zopfochytrium polystomum]
MACRRGNKDVANVLLSFGATFDPDEYGATPVHWAAHNDRVDLLQSLIRIGHVSHRHLQLRDAFGSTPLHFASVLNLEKMVKALVKAGSDPLITNNDGRKPSDLATNQSVLELLADAERLMLAERAKASSRKQPTPGEGTQQNQTVRDEPRPRSSARGRPKSGGGDGKPPQRSSMTAAPNSTGAREAQTRSLRKEKGTTAARKRRQTDDWL